MPRHLYALPLHDGALALLALLYTYADADEIAAAMRGEGPPAFVWPSWAELQAARGGKARSTIGAALALLTEAGQIRRAERSNDERPARAAHGPRRLVGWELTPTPAPPRRTSSNPDPSGRPDADGLPGRTVRPAGPSGRPDGARPADRTPTVRPAGPLPPQTPLSPDLTREPTTSTTNAGTSAPGGWSDLGDTMHLMDMAGPGFSPTRTRVVARRPVAPAPDDPTATVGCNALARAILTDCAHLFTPTNALGVAVPGRRIHQDRGTLERVELLLAPPEGVEDAAGWVRERAAFVRQYAAGYADLCHRETRDLAAAGGPWRVEDTRFVRWWGGMMFDPRPSAGKRSAPWDMLVRAVDADADAKAASAAGRQHQHKAAEARAQLEAPDTPDQAAAREAMVRQMEADKAALFDSLTSQTVLDRPSRRPARRGGLVDEERERRHGAWCEGQDERDQATLDELRRQMNAALVQAHQAAGRPLTLLEAQTIRDRFA